MIGTAKSIQALQTISSELKCFVLSNLTDDELDSQYTLTKIPFWRCQPYVRPNPEVKEKISRESREIPKCSKSKKIAKKELTKLKVKKQWIKCLMCERNPKGLKCVNDLCKCCCKIKSVRDTLDCQSHHLFFKTKYFSNLDNNLESS
jgi:tRNA-dihydrouridine synthase 1